MKSLTSRVAKIIPTLAAAVALGTGVAYGETVADYLKIIPKDKPFTVRCQDEKDLEIKDSCNYGIKTYMRSGNKVVYQTDKMNGFENADMDLGNVKNIAKLYQKVSVNGGSGKPPAPKQTPAEIAREMCEKNPEICPNKPEEKTEGKNGKDEETQYPSARLTISDEAGSKTEVVIDSLTEKKYAEKEHEKGETTTDAMYGLLGREPMAQIPQSQLETKCKSYPDGIDCPVKEKEEEKPGLDFTFGVSANYIIGEKINGLQRNTSQYNLDIGVDEVAGEMGFGIFAGLRNGGLSGKLKTRYSETAGAATFTEETKYHDIKSNGQVFGFKVGTPRWKIGFGYGGDTLNWRKTSHELLEVGDLSDENTVVTGGKDKSIVRQMIGSYTFDNGATINAIIEKSTFDEFGKREFGAGIGIGGTFGGGK
ncbi:hypothetical protein HYT25_02480 [Candidatus Pacearchaeota archaeon]|nr:hypothetical protein [Candidatus Pacearchaeota archaeon]